MPILIMLLQVLSKFHHAKRLKVKCNLRKNWLYKVNTIGIKACCIFLIIQKVRMYQVLSL